MPFARIPSGDAGTRATIRVMRRLANEGVRSALTINLVSSIVSGVRNRQTQVQALRGWVAHKVQFQRDPYGVETIRTVPQMLTAIQRTALMQGDCDDVAVLAAALGKAAGNPARFVVLAFVVPGAPFAHVFTEVWDGMAWQSFDVTRPRRLPTVTRRATFDV